jgi:oxygen-independent coproporphyrinogen-3 oxidase
MQNEAIDAALVQKYNQALPRYTSYPTVPFWKDTLAVSEWTSVFKTRFAEQNALNGISIYVHLPFCESLCTYCGCTKKITTNHSVEEEYLEAIAKEWQLYRRLMNVAPIIREIHLGGGTPTFFSPRNLQLLMQVLRNRALVHPQHEFSIEGHPNNTTVAHLQALYEAGFRRISYGVQDLDADVQRVINRIQPFENLEAATQHARDIGFTSVNFDLIYGLPLQTAETMERTIGKVLELQPDRIAFYNYAHVPWTSKSQRLFDESDLPGPEAKLALYLLGKKMLLQNGYADIGMDHFALPSDNLFKAWKWGRLRRNFMGYTTQNTGLLLGLGMSAISDSGNAFAQNNKSLLEYYRHIHAGELAIQRGYILSEEDMAFRKYILDMSCQGLTRFREADLPVLEQVVFPKLAALEKDGLVEWDHSMARLTAQGHYFIRNVCSAFDLFLNRTAAQHPVFSKSI